MNGDLVTIFIREETFDFPVASLHTNPLLKREVLNKKEFAPSGSKFFNCIVEPFSEGTKTIVRVTSPVSVFISRNNSHFSVH